MTIELKYVALTPIHIQEMVSEKEPLLDEDGAYVFTDYQPGDEVPALMWGPKVINRMVEYRRILPVAADGLGSDNRAGETLPSPPPAPLAVTSYDIDDTKSFPVHHGGPWYVLSDGRRVKGAKMAAEEQALIEALVEG